MDQRDSLEETAKILQSYNYNNNYNRFNLKKDFSSITSTTTTTTATTEILSTVQYHLLVIAASFVFCSFCYWISSNLSRIWSKSYREKLDDDQKVEWDSRIVSNINALFSVLVVFPSIFSSEYNGNPVENSAQFTEFGTLCIIGYFIYDAILILRNWKSLGSRGIMIHHIQSIASAYWFVCTKCGIYFCALMAVTELTTPLVNLRWFLSATGRRSDPIYVYNGIAMWLLFGIVRIGVIIHIAFRIYQWTPLFLAAPWPCIILMASTYGILSILNFYWFYLLSKGLFRVLFEKKDKRHLSYAKSERTGKKLKNCDYKIVKEMKDEYHNKENNNNNINKKEKEN